jgi:HPt (histidine-containing phosphotransfer) domain-containing protein
MDDYVSKPIRHDALAAVVQRRLPAGESASPNGHANGGPHADDHADPLDYVLDDAIVMRIRQTLTPEKRRTLIDRFDVQQEECVVEIGAAIRRGDRGAVRRVAHKLKGSSASLGAIRLRVCCQRLELGEEDDSDLGEPQIAALRVAASEASEALRHELVH